MSCGVGCRHGSNPKLLWLWHRLAIIALIGPLAWEPPYAAGVALEKAKRQKEKKKPHTHTHTHTNNNTLISPLTFNLHSRNHCSYHSLEVLQIFLLINKTFTGL